MCFVAVVDLNLVPSLHNSLPEAAAVVAAAAAMQTALAVNDR